MHNTMFVGLDVHGATIESVSRSIGFVPCRDEMAAAFVFADEVADGTDGFAEVFVGAGSGFAQRRSTRRHLNEAQLPAGKTLATFNFQALPTLPRAGVEALAAGDRLEGGGNLIAIGNSGSGKTHVLCAIGHALIQAGHCGFHSRTSDLVQRLQAARPDLVPEAALVKLGKFDLTPAGDPFPVRIALPPPP